MTGRQEYFEQARGWAVDTRLREARMRRIAWTVAGIATAVALFEAVALALVTPLKAIQPITLLVDRTTGYVQALDPLQPQRIRTDAALTQSFLAQYVIAREGFDRATISPDYRKVALWSSGVARSQYLALMPATNPDSPLARYPGTTTIAARVKSVSPLADGTALVRFDTQQQDRNGGVGPAQPWISVIHYRYSEAPMAFEDRLINPLGFQVTSYRRDPEAAPPPSPGAANAEAAEFTPMRRAAIGVVPSTADSNASSAASSYGGRIIVRRGPFGQMPLGSPLTGRRDGRAPTGGQP